MRLYHGSDVEVRSIDLSRSLMAAGASADVLFEKLEREFAGVTSEVDTK